MQSRFAAESFRAGLWRTHLDREPVAGPSTSFLESSRSNDSPQTFRVQCGHSRATHGRCRCSLLVFCCLMDARGGAETCTRSRLATRRSKASRGLLRRNIGNTCAASILETAEDAAYSSPRRKKSKSHPGDSRLHARRAEWATFAREAISEPLLACSCSKPSLPLADSVTCLESTAASNVKSGEGEGSWACGRFYG